MYYATNPAPINEALDLGRATSTEWLLSRRQRFYEPKGPGYRTHEPARAPAVLLRT